MPGQRMNGTAPARAQAVVSDDGKRIRLTTYDANAAALAVVELSPLAALRLAYVLLQAALRHLGQKSD
jgi:hypothetical protein